MEQKKGQTTTFVIVGIVIVAVALLLIFLRGQFLFGPVTQETLENRLTSLEEHVADCLGKLGPGYFERIGLQGGYLKTPEGTYRLQDDITVSYLCYDIPGKVVCANRMLTLQDMESQLSEVLREGMSTCLDLGTFKRGVSLKVGTMDLHTSIGADATIVTLDMPVLLEKGELRAERKTFSKTFAVPLGRLYNVAMDIVDVETEFGDFEQLTYMLAHRGQIIIDKKKPYPDKLYILQTKDSPYLFQFFVEGEPG